MHTFTCVTAGEAELLSCLCEPGEANTRIPNMSISLLLIILVQDLALQGQLLLPQSHFEVLQIFSTVDLCQPAKAQGITEGS